MNRYRLYLLLLISLSATPMCRGQQILQRIITVDIHNQPVSQALKTISKRGKFQFSYNSSLVPRDSLVSLSVQDKTVRQTLDMLFGGRFEYRETGDYLILHLPSGTGQTWYVSGYVLDRHTGERIRDVSVYETQQLISTITNDQGFFRLRLKDRYPTAMISVRKAWYSDTSVILKPGEEQELTVRIAPKDIVLDTLVVTPVEKTWLGNVFVSSRQRVQSINLGKYFLDKPFQTSVIPGIGTHGRMSPQVVNKFSFNIVGGYTAGIQGFELGGTFNIVKNDMRYAQIAGVFNMVGGHTEGVQIAGVHNQTLGNVSAVQLAGIDNICAGNMEGVQASGVCNLTSGQVSGLQLAGAGNISRLGVRGMQLSGAFNIAGKSSRGMQLTSLGNISAAKIRGAQVSALFNYTRSLQGFQLGIINIADTSEGYSLGLINIVRKRGYHKISLYANESIPLNLAVKTGNHKLYSILIAGINPAMGSRAVALGYGLGSDIFFSKRTAFNPELHFQHIYLGDWRLFNYLTRLNLNIHVRMAKNISFFAGPSFIYYVPDQLSATDGYSPPVPGYTHYTYYPKRSPMPVHYWIGGNIGINFF